MTASPAQTAVGWLVACSTRSRAVQHVVSVLDEDGEVFLDYPRVMSDFPAGVPEFARDELGMAIDVHKREIETQLETCSGAVRDMYVWLADYDNWPLPSLVSGTQ